ncbi:MAG: hypothetical protein A2Y54_01825 [Chloroflexi bacterium RBG_16_51_16]|nr:MAG: hypothetical protein A2Y54_01825 [Chloroflexi bacterium RBG_16_51_16]
MTLETVWVETPAAEATCLMVERPVFGFNVIVPVIDNILFEDGYIPQVTNVMADYDIWKIHLP